MNTMAWELFAWTIFSRILKLAASSRTYDSHGCANFFIHSPPRRVRCPHHVTFILVRPPIKITCLYHVVSRFRGRTSDLLNTSNFYGIQKPTSYHTSRDLKVCRPARKPDEKNKAEGVTSRYVIILRRRGDSFDRSNYCIILKKTGLLFYLTTSLAKSGYIG